MSTELPAVLSEIDRLRVERQDAIMARIEADERTLAVQAGALANEKRREQEKQGALREDILARYQIGKQDKVLPGGEIQRATRLRPVDEAV